MSVTVIVAPRLPVALGSNVAAITQLDDAARLVVLVHCAPLEGVTIAKSAEFVPPSTMFEMFSAALPVLVRVTVCCPVVTPTSEPPNVMVVEFRLATGAMAVPLKETGNDATGDVSEIVSVAVRFVPPDAAGVNVTPIVQEEFAATVLPVQLLFTSAKSPGLVPVIVGRVPETVAAEPVGLLSVTVCEPLVVPTDCALNVSELGDTLTFGFVPVPERVTRNEPPVKFTVAVPALVEPVGANLM